jgi:hypothetical protein
VLVRDVPGVGELNVVRDVAGARDVNIWRGLEVGSGGELNGGVADLDPVARG